MPRFDAGPCVDMGDFGRARAGRRGTGEAEALRGHTPGLATVGRLPIRPARASKATAGDWTGNGSRQPTRLYMVQIELKNGVRGVQGTILGQFGHLFPSRLHHLML